MDTVEYYHMEDHPKEMSKKILLVKHFHEYLEGKMDEFLQEELSPEEIRENEKDVWRLVHVKKWMRTKHAILFRLNNKVVQVCFQDNTEIIICSDSRIVTYVCKKGTRENFTLQEAVDS